MSETSDSYDALRARWDKLALDLAACDKLADTGGLIPERRPHQFWKTFDAAYGVFKEADDDQDSTMVSACYADLYRLESEAAMHCPVTHKGAKEPLPSHDIETATPALKAAKTVSDAGDAIEKNLPNAPRGIWDSIPFGVKIAGGLGLAAWLASSLAKLRR